MAQASFHYLLLIEQGKNKEAFHQLLRYLGDLAGLPAHRLTKLKAPRIACLYALSSCFHAYKQSGKMEAISDRVLQAEARLNALGWLHGLEEIRAVEPLLHHPAVGQPFLDLRLSAEGNLLASGLCQTEQAGPISAAGLKAVIRSKTLFEIAFSEN